MGKKKNREKKEITLVDIVYPVYSQYDALDKSLATLDDAADGIPYKVYLVDDHSKDIETVGRAFYESLKKTPGKIASIIYHKQNMGYAKTVNDGANIGNSKYILVMSTDVFLTQGSIKIMVEHIESNPDIALISPKLLFPPNSTDPQRPANKIQHAGLAFDITGKPFHLFSAWPENHPHVNRVRDLNAVTGACFLIRRDIWHKLKGYSIEYGKGTFEDVDLCLRIRMSGNRIRFLPQAVGYHSTNLSVLGAGEGFPLDRNYNIFRARFGTNIPYDEWLHMGIVDE